LESDVQRLSNMLARLHKNAVDIGSQQRCTVVRRRRRIGVHGVKVASTLSSQPLQVADNFADHPQLTYH
jgi:hypothetical protein